jgi:hypothetical protein
MPSARTLLLVPSGLSGKVAVRGTVTMAVPGLEALPSEPWIQNN